MPNHDVIVIGASAGGVDALRTLVAALPENLPASILIVMHVLPYSPGALPLIFSTAGSLPAKLAEDGERLEHGQIYVAPPDQHLLLEPGHLRVVQGPKENRHRPAIDPMFRSAAWAYGPRVVGIVLTGTLDDGAAGLWSIQCCGGITVVQDPAEAKFPGMPLSALASIDVDHKLPLRGIAKLLTRLVREPVLGGAVTSRPDSIRVESDYANVEKEHEFERMDQIGSISPFTCPACQGALWELDSADVLRYRCHVGHAFSPDSLIQGQGEAVEQALYASVRALEEKAAMLRRLSGKFRGRGGPADRLIETFEAKATEVEESANTVRELLASGKA